MYRINEENIKKLTKTMNQRFDETTQALTKISEALWEMKKTLPSQGDNENVLKALEKIPQLESNVPLISNLRPNLAPKPLPTSKSILVTPGATHPYQYRETQHSSLKGEQYRAWYDPTPCPAPTQFKLSLFPNTPSNTIVPEDPRPKHRESRTLPPLSFIHTRETSVSEPNDTKMDIQLLNSHDINHQARLVHSQNHVHKPAGVLHSSQPAKVTKVVSRKQKRSPIDCSKYDLRERVHS